jgi:hypothetical protein
VRRWQPRGDENRLVFAKARTTLCGSHSNEGG